MTADEQRLVLMLVNEGMPQKEFLKQFRNSGDGVALVNELLDEAVMSRDGIDVEMALLVGFVFGFTDKNIPALICLAGADWHERHEDVVSALSDLKSVETVDSLFHATQWTPAYLQFDKSRALAVKAIWGLGGVTGIQAEARLRQLVDSSVDALLKSEALRQLKRRGD